MHINTYLNTFDSFIQSYLWNILSVLYLKTYFETNEPIIFLKLFLVNIMHSTVGVDD